MSNVYERLGVATIVNAKGTATRVSGGRMPREVAAAMYEATQHCVDMAALQGRASEIIAEATGAQAGMVTAGASAGLLLGTAACLAGLDPARMNRLPDTAGMPDEVVVVRSQRNFYDHAVRAAGARLVEVGIADRFSGAGVRDAEAWEIDDAIGERTAGVFYVAQPSSRPALVAVAEVAHAKGVPLLVDAAAQLPPAGNLRRFLREGADLVSFSGGKAILGPQGSGILCGRRDLIASALLQNLDQDLFFEQWRPPPALFAGVNLRGLPQHGIGRSCKVGKEQVVGLLTALGIFAGEDIEARNRRCLARLQELVAQLAPALAGRARIERSTDDQEPLLVLELSSPPGGPCAFDLVVALQDGTPSIHVDPGGVEQGVVVMRALCLEEGDPPVIAQRLNEILGQPRDRRKQERREFRGAR